MSHIQDLLTSTLRRGRSRCTSPSRSSTVDVAAGGAARADRLVALQEPDPHLEAEVVGEQRAHRAHVGQVARVAVGDGPFSKVAIWVWSPRFTNSKVLVPVTSRSKRRQREQSTQRSASSMIGPRSTTLRFLTFSSISTSRVVQAVLHVAVLQVALAGLVADRAVDGVVDEQELQGRCAAVLGALSLVVCTTMPSVTAVLQAIWSLGIFSISTRQMRQLPSTGRSGCQQKYGMSMPCVEGRLDDGGPRRDLDLLAVDGALGHAVTGPARPAITLRPPMMATASASRPPLIISREGLVDVVAGRAHLHPPGMLAAVAHDVVAELAVRGLGVAVDLARRGRMPS